MKYILRYNNNKYRYSTNRECHLLTLILNNHFLSPFALLGLVRSEAGKAGYSPAYNLRDYGSVHFIMCSPCRTKSMCQTVLDDSQVLPCPFSYGHCIVVLFVLRRFMDYPFGILNLFLYVYYV